MGGEPGSPGVSPPRFRPWRTRGPGAEPPVYKCTAYKGAPPRFGSLG